MTDNKDEANATIEEFSKFWMEILVQEVQLVRKL